ncbi:hypothetical protein ACRALDRAFT_210001 [Sodiomyces alcalophilus JCM 7366]|uniref:uncharacterized protein n=1 Tax=Sodiomyces alcalophilus JCM 7366 TaxID=591952 RepID=UPI0039B63677
MPHRPFSVACSGLKGFVMMMPPVFPAADQHKLYNVITRYRQWSVPRFLRAGMKYLTQPPGKIIQAISLPPLFPHAAKLPIAYFAFCCNLWES